MINQELRTDADAWIPW